jgi:hypothetical protein
MGGLLGAAPPAVLSAGPAPVPPDTAAVTVRTPSTETLARYRTDPAYTYESTSASPGWWDRFAAWVAEQWAHATAVPWASEILFGLAVLACTGLLLVGAYWLVRARRTRPVEASAPTAPGASVTREEMDTVDFAARAAEAEADEAYRAALRWHYLAVLQHLMRVGLIDWTPDKANRALVRETRGHPVHDRFARATDVFEAVWYGGVSVREASYDDLRAPMTAARNAASMSSSPSTA